MLKLTTDKHKASLGLSATAELLVCVPNAVWASASDAFRIVSDTLVLQCHHV